MRATPARTLKAAPRIDIPYRHYLSQVNGSCSVIQSPYSSDVNECVETTPWAYGGKVGSGGGESDHGLACCYNTTGVQVSQLLLLINVLPCCPGSNTTTTEKEKNSLHRWRWTGTQNQPDRFVHKMWCFLRALCFPDSASHSADLLCCNCTTSLLIDKHAPCPNPSLPSQNFGCSSCLIVSLHSHPLTPTQQRTHSFC